MRKRLLAVLAAAMAIMTVAPATVSAETYTKTNVKSLCKMQELDEAINPGKGAVADLWMYEGQIAQTTGTQGMLLPATCVRDNCICNHVKTESTNVAYDPGYAMTGRDLRETDIVNTSNKFCRVLYVTDETQYAYTEGDAYVYTNFLVYGIRAGEYSITYRHYSSVSTYEEYVDDDGFECARKISSEDTLDYTYTLRIHVLPMEVTQRYYTVKPGQVITPQTPVALPVCYFVGRDSSIDDIYTEQKKIENGVYMPILVVKENKDNVFVQQGNSVIAREEMVEYGQWIAMYAPFYDFEGAYEDVTEYSQFHVTVSDTNLNVTKKTMKVGDSFKLRIKDGTTFSRVEALYASDQPFEEEQFGSVTAGRTYASRSINMDKGKQVIKFGTESKGYDKKDCAFKYITVKATKKGKCLLKVYPYENDNDYFFICQITVK